MQWVSNGLCNSCSQVFVLSVPQAGQPLNHGCFPKLENFVVKDLMDRMRPGQLGRPLARWLHPARKEGVGGREGGGGCYV